MNIIPMTVAELIEELQALPPGHDVYLATQKGTEPLAKEDLCIKRLDGRVPTPALIITPSVQQEEQETLEDMLEDLSVEGIEDMCCEHADGCMHFERALSVRASRRARNLAIAKASDFMRN